MIKTHLMNFQNLELCRQNKDKKNRFHMLANELTRQKQVEQIRARQSIRKERKERKQSNTWEKTETK